MNTVRAKQAEAGSAMNRSLKHYSQLFKSRSIVNFDEKNEVSSLLLDKSCILWKTLQSICFQFIAVTWKPVCIYFYFFLH